MRNIHIGYGDSATGCLQEAIDKHGLIGDEAVPLRDDFTQGPISESLRPNGLNQRIAYWESVDRVLGFGFNVRKFYNKSINILEELDVDEVTIWPGHSCHDILATGWLISYLKHKNFKWFIVNLAKVKKADQLQGLPVVNLAMYSPRQVADLYKYRKSLSESDIKYFTAKWNQAAEENSPYRILEDDKVVSVDEDYFDAYILSHIQPQFEPTSQVIGGILRDGQHRISDTTVEWNIRKMIDRGIIDFIGDVGSISSCSIRNKRTNISNTK